MSLHYNITRLDVGTGSTVGVGKLVRDGVELFTSFTLENTKCRIAPGTYRAEFTRSPKFSAKAGKDVFTWEIFGVIDSLNPATPNRVRAGIRIHPVNFAHHLLGCVAPGMELADLDRDGNIDIARSREALAAFEKACGDHKGMMVTIIDPV
jgi:hypothetical protein